MVGTAMNSVTAPAAKRSHTCTGSKPPGASQVAPDQSAQHTTLTMPWTWCSGSTSRMRSSADHAHSSTRPSICARRLSCVCTTPFGRPVVPLVYTMSARRSGPIAGNPVAGPAVAARVGTTISTEAPRGSARRRASSACAGEASSTSTPASATT